MKKILLFSLIFICIIHIGFGQDINGKWLGKLNVGMELQIVFNITSAEGLYSSTLDSPDQNAYGILTASTTFVNNELAIQIPAIQGAFYGIYNAANNTIEGNWTQGSGSLPLVLNKVTSVEPIKRKQDPVKPYPYKEEEITFENKNADSVFLSGTLTIPEGKGPFNAVVLVTGSGPQNRNENLLGHSPFLVLSDYLTRNGIIVLRYDDRGISKSTGDFGTATSKDFADDANAAVNYLKSRKDLNIKNIGIAGHSEGGLIAPLAASQNKNVDFAVLIAGTGIPGDSVLCLQGSLIEKASGYSEDALAFLNNWRRDIIHVVETESDMDVIASKIIAINKKISSNASEDLIEELQLNPDDSTAGVDFFASAWMKYFLTYDPRPILEKTKIPVLAINGTLDLQVPYRENLDAIENALKIAGNKNYKIVALENLNHLFQTTATGSPSEYGMLEETFNENAMKVIAVWVLTIN